MEFIERRVEGKEGGERERKREMGREREGGGQAKICLLLQKSSGKESDGEWEELKGTFCTLVQTRTLGWLTYCLGSSCRVTGVSIMPDIPIFFLL